MNPKLVAYKILAHLRHLLQKSENSRFFDYEKPPFKSRLSSVDSSDNIIETVCSVYLVYLYLEGELRKYDVKTMHSFRWINSIGYNLAGKRIARYIYSIENNMDKIQFEFLMMDEGIHRTMRLSYRCMSINNSEILKFEKLVEIAY
jgi:hypothetical protein